MEVLLGFILAIAIVTIVIAIMAPDYIFKDDDDPYWDPENAIKKEDER